MIEPHLHWSLHLIKRPKMIVDKEPVDEMIIDKILQAIEGFQQSWYIYFYRWTHIPPLLPLNEQI